MWMPSLRDSQKFQADLSDLKQTSALPPEQHPANIPRKAKGRRNVIPAGPRARLTSSADCQAASLLLPTAAESPAFGLSLPPWSDDTVCLCFSFKPSCDSTHDTPCSPQSVCPKYSIVRRWPMTNARYGDLDIGRVSARNHTCRSPTRTDTASRTTRAVRGRPQLLPSRAH